MFMIKKELYNIRVFKSINNIYYILYIQYINIS